MWLFWRPKYNPIIESAPQEAVKVAYPLKVQWIEICKNARARTYTHTHTQQKTKKTKTKQVECFWNDWSYQQNWKEEQNRFNLMCTVRLLAEISTGFLQDTYNGSIWHPLQKRLRKFSTSSWHTYYIIQWYHLHSPPRGFWCACDYRLCVLVVWFILLYMNQWWVIRIIIVKLDSASIVQNWVETVTTRTCEQQHTHMWHLNEDSH